MYKHVNADTCDMHRWVYRHGLHSAGVALWGVAVIIHVVLILLFSRHVVAAVRARQWDNVSVGCVYMCLCLFVCVCDACM